MFRISMMCKLLNVSKAGYYAWRDRASSEHQLADQRLLTRIKLIHRASRQTYGSPRIHAALRREGIRVGRKRVRTEGVAVRIRRRFRVTTNSKHGHPIAPNIVNRRFGLKAIKAADKIWASDITYIDTLEGWVYLAVVIDLRSRRVIGWSMSQSMAEQLVIDALTMALMRRTRPRGIIHHSDRGSQYAGVAYRKLLHTYGIRCSMSRKGNCWDNAVVESFNATIKTELVHRTKWTTREEVRAAVYSYIETWYNSQRLHSTLGYRSPSEFEEQDRSEAA
jgi:putative transposase